MLVEDFLTVWTLQWPLGFTTTFIPSIWTTGATSRFGILGGYLPWADLVSHVGAWGQEPYNRRLQSYRQKVNAMLKKETKDQKQKSMQC